MSFVQDSYRIEDPRDATIQSLRKLVAALNVQLGQLANRISVLEGSRPASLDAGGYEITNAGSGLTSQSSVPTRKDLQDRSIYRRNKTSVLQTSAVLHAQRSLSRRTPAVKQQEVVSLAQLDESELRNGRTLRLQSDVALAATDWFDVTGLEFVAAENTTYAIEATVLFTVGATNQGINLACNGPASPTAMSFTWTAPGTTIAEVARSVTAYDTSTANATSVAGDNIARFKGIFKNGSTGGTWILRASLDAAISTGTVLAGSSLRYAILS